MSKSYTFVLFLGFFLIGCFSKVQQCSISIDNEGTTTDDCPAQYNCINGECIHKDIFPVNGREVGGSILTMILAGLANTGGIGGGSVLSPVLLIIFNYDANKAIMLVYILIFGGSLGTYLNVAFQRDIQTKKPIVLYDFVLMVGPMMLIGSNIGVLLNRVIPPIATISGLICLMISTLRKVSQKAKICYAKETKMLQGPLLPDKKDNQTKTEEIELTLLNDNKKSESNSEVQKLSQSSELKAIIEEDESLFPKRKLAFLGCLLLFQLIITILRGTDKFHSLIGVEFCSTGYWGWFLIGLLGSFLFFLKGSNIVKQNLEVKRRFNYEADSYNINSDNIRKLGLLGIWAGVLAAVLGIGGGLVLGTTLMVMGVEAQSMTASSNCFVVITSLISLFQAFLFGGISSHELIFFFLISSIGSYSVSCVITLFVKKYQRPSILLIVLSIMLIISLFITPSFALWKSIQNPSQMLSFHSLC